MSKPAEPKRYVERAIRCPNWLPGTPPNHHCERCRGWLFIIVREPVRRTDENR